MFYHFCLISLFRLYIDIQPDGVVANPQEICLQAAESVVLLSESYSKVFDVSFVQPLVPYFLGAAASLCLTLGEKGLCNEGSPLSAIGVRSELKSEADEMLKMAHLKDQAYLENEPQDHCGPFTKHLQLASLPPCSYRSTTVLTRACRLLADMSSKHPTAVAAEGILCRSLRISSWRWTSMSSRLPHESVDVLSRQ